MDSGILDVAKAAADSGWIVPVTMMELIHTGTEGFAQLNKFALHHHTKLVADHS